GLLRLPARFLLRFGDLSPGRRRPRLVGGAGPGRGATRRLGVGRSLLGLLHPAVALLLILVLQRRVGHPVGAASLAVGFHGAVVRFLPNLLGVLIGSKNRLRDIGLLFRHTSLLQSGSDSP